ncbi:hypothetical protein Pmar_PMAR024267 [Perkinsus marinus ATCC 50983]|uniref:Uncharacterized protein n=1 Tax=Perkinsus marinus (strain ATCC 50983 / TXsc) TaxID=423536 RepID=C5L9A6_PERM5|nr:hypothetical protein Pmar_PMAR024267 [Perkinsus marinus ATCC 50983]EER06677.1 hypothetical protein Pmar_PMAR024267 [Perkinsus marinus ATCC 50983]|eukprot:XP_002774861.1 hypothetical protein Pmar_PMAR024267 [Perkinsus marinus ATCC 50983]
MRKQELLSEHQLEQRERENGEEEGEAKRPRKRTVAERRIAMIKEEEIKAG